jgi:hypothetical protein
VFNTKQAYLRLRVAGLTASQADQICKTVQKWIACNGEQETVERIKAIKVNLLHHFAGIALTKYHSWTRQKPDGTPKGAFGCLFRLGKKQFRTAWNSIMVYTGLIYQDREVKVTVKQWNKMVSVIRRAPLEPEVLVEGIRVVHQSPFFVSLNVREGSGSPLADYSASPSRRAPKGYRTVPEIDAVYESLRPLIAQPLWTSRNWDILSGTVRGFENDFMPDLELNLEFEAKASGGQLDAEELPDMGIISLIQEGGYKLRFAANPYRVYQQALQPLGRVLFAALKRVPNDYTFDQEAAIPKLQRWISEGRTMCSMDLSNCSDNLPLDLQLEALSRYGVGTRWLQFFKETCRGRWYTSPGLPSTPSTFLSWTVGSPLGLYPTFAAFSILHHNLVQWSFQASGYRPFSKEEEEAGEFPYVIVGDDVCIADEQTALIYRGLMQSLGVPISEHKTLWGKDVAEFIGRVVTSNSVIQGFKWKGRVSDQSFVAFCQMFGPRALGLLNARQKRVVSYIADLPEPYGLGWNPLGIPLIERMPPWLERVWDRDERLRTFEKRSTKVNRLLYHSGVEYWLTPGREADAESLSSDQEDERLLESVFPGLTPYGMPVLANAVEVALAKGIPHDLSESLTDLLRRTSSAERQSELTALVVLERKVRRSLRTWRRSP